MPAVKRAAFVFSVTVVCTVYLTAIRANGIGENDFVTSVRGLSFKSHVWSQDFGPTQWNDTDAEVRQHAGCNCQYGKCVRDGDRELCVCEPQFALVGDSECTYCDCGIGFNCTFTRNFWGNPRYSKDCHCPYGYQETNGRCREECSPSKRCKNGGICSLGKCRCKTGTLGDFCETIEGCTANCRPRKIVDCQYAQSDETYVCLCKNRSLVYDYRERRCKPCPCGEHGRCVYDDRTLECECDEGYKIYNGYCKRCYCGPSGYGCSFRTSGEKSCLCQSGSVVREGYCVDCDCGDHGTTCSVDNGVKKCECATGFEDRFGVCEDIDECKSNDSCASTAKCINTVGSYQCECEEGYKARFGGIKEGCEDIDECWITNYCSSWDRTRCVNLPGTYKCECEIGYQPISMTVEPIKTECELYKQSWVPSILTFSTVGFILITVLVTVKCLEYRNNNRLR